MKHSHPDHRSLLPLSLSRILTVALFSVLWGAGVVAAPLDEVVGTWEKSDSTLLEFKADGTIFSRGAPIGRWMRESSSKQAVFKLSGAEAACSIHLAYYQRTMTVRQMNSKVTATLKRVDEGPTLNPDVPNVRKALQLEHVDVKAEIEETILRLDRAKTEAADLWREYEEARAMGRSTNRKSKAASKDSEVQGLERRLVEKRKRLALLALEVGEEPRKATSPRAAPATASVSRTALKLQCVDVQAEIEKITLNLEHAKQEAANLWRDYNTSRDLNRATNGQIKARNKDSEVRSLENRLVDMRKQLALLNLQLEGVK